MLRNALSTRCRGHETVTFKKFDDELIEASGVFNAAGVAGLG